jgi:hypothetical protein
MATAETIFFLLVWLGVMLAFRERAFNDPGALWHVRVGEQILTSGFMETDPFTYTFRDQTWIPQQWGGEIAMALAHTFSGLDGLLLGLATLLAGCGTWLFSRLLQGGMHPLLAGGVMAFALFCCSYHFYSRPHMATLVFMPLVLAALVEYERNRISAWGLYALIPLCVLWTNIHGGVLGGVLTFGLTVLGWGGLFLLGKESPITSWRQGFLLAGIVLTCLLTPFLNPFGLEMLATWQRIVGSSAMKEFVSEHQPLSLANTTGQVTVAFAVLYGAALLGVPFRKVRITWLMPLVWFVLALQGIRQGPLFVMLAVVALADLWPETLWHRLLLHHGDTLARLPGQFRGLRWVEIPGVFVGTVMLLQSMHVMWPVVGRGWARLDARHHPVELAEFFAELPVSSVPQVFNDANMGGYVLYQNPQIKLFMDDRFELYGDAWLRDYVDVVYNKPERFENWADEYGFDYAAVLIEPDRTKLEQYLSESPRWELIQRGERAVLFRRIPLSLVHPHEQAPAHPLPRQLLQGQPLHGAAQSRGLHGLPADNRSPAP